MREEVEERCNTVANQIEAAKIHFNACCSGLIKLESQWIDIVRIFERITPLNDEVNLCESERKATKSAFEKSVLSTRIESHKLQIKTYFVLRRAVVRFIPL